MDVIPSASLRHGHIARHYLFARKIKYVSLNYIAYFSAQVILVGVLLFTAYSRNRLCNTYVKCQISSIFASCSFIPTKSHYLGGK